MLTIEKAAQLLIVSMILVSAEHSFAYQYFTVGSATDFSDGVYNWDKVSERTVGDPEQYVPLWKQNKIVFQVPNTLPKSYVGLTTFDDFKKTLERTKLFWNSKNAGITIDFEFGPAAKTLHTDGKNTFFSTTSGKIPEVPPGYSGVAIANIKKAGDVFEVDSCDLAIFFDEFPSAKDHDPKKIQSELYQVITHEIGHCFGLAHSSIPKSVMSYPGVGQSIDWDSNLMDDQLALQNLYPAPGLNSKIRGGTIRGELENVALKQPSTNQQILFIDPTGKLILDLYSGIIERRKTDLGPVYNANSGKFIVQYVPAGTYYAIVQDDSHMKDMDIVTTPKSGSSSDTTDTIQRVGLTKIHVINDGVINLGKIFVDSRHEDETGLIDELLLDSDTNKWIEMGSVKYSFPLKRGKTYKVRCKPREAINLTAASLRFLNEALQISNPIAIEDGWIEFDLSIGMNTDPSPYKFISSTDNLGKPWVFRSKLSLVDASRTQRLPAPIPTVPTNIKKFPN